MSRVSTAHCNRSRYAPQRTLLAPLCLSLLCAAELAAAPAFDPGLQPLGSIAPISLSNSDLSGGDVRAYRTWFENGGWQGDLVEYTVSDLGALSTSVDLSGVSPANEGAPPSNWSAHVRFALAEIVNGSYWDTGREIVIWNGFSQEAFRWDNLSDAQQAALDQTAFDNDETSSDILNYIRGERSNETPSGSLRSRASVLGDMIHSNPVYVGPPKGSYTEHDYAVFAADHSTRDERIYVGANDGMLHAFDADDGSEAWAYIPSMLIPELDRLAGRPYTHQYYVDGSLTVKDTFNGTAWQTVLVGGLGAGGKGWFGLDITYPDIANEDAIGGTDIKVLWELDASSDDDLGYAFGQAVISKLNDGKWYAVLGNGYNSVNGLAKLYLVNIASGGITRISTGSGSAESPNGLSSPSLVDTNGDGTADIVYAGDIDGHMWKFDLTGNTSGNWAVAYAGVPIHPGDSSQPIIQAPDVTLHPATGHLVMFGTGRLFTEADMADNSVQAMYGIWDSGNVPPDADAQSLLTQTLSGDQDYTAVDIAETVQTYNPDPGAIDWSTQHGWNVPLPAGFRVLQPPQLRGGRLKVTINQPGTRANYLLESYYLDGGSPGHPIFDLDRTGTLSSSDNIDVNDDGDLVDSEDVVVMWAQPAGVMSQPTIARVAQGIDTQMLNYVVPPAQLPCTGDCPGGFQGGHIDVDTDYYNHKAKKDDPGGVGGKTYFHTHEYDKKTGRVYVDYTEIGMDKHVELSNESLIPQDDEFIVIVANADLSPGSVLTLDDREYNVVEYQTMIHKKLRAWDGDGDLTDDDGNTLIFSAAGLAASGGTVRHSFDDMAILAGGLHPTITGCVNKTDAVTNGRYRNGSLVTQAVSRSMFSGAGNMLDRLTVQIPGDLPQVVVLSDGSQVDMKEDFDDSGAFDADNYEIFGGLRATISGQGDTDALFESTLFWHYTDLAGAACYGDDNWEAEVLAARDAAVLTQDEFDQILADLGIADLAAEVASHEGCKDTSESNGGCMEYYQLLQALLELETTITEGGINSETGLESDGESPVIVEGAATEQGITVGPNFRAGRRTWVDILAD
ncbi:MAG: PilC/PilY family type IV pilus protein [Gammaproteobacteria bacterium]|nr:PilC/PilY family type IV pilus protein [Gammaproteobacteria bacterium]